MKTALVSTDMSQGYERYTERMPASDLPEVPRYVAQENFEALLPYIGKIPTGDIRSSVEPEEIRNIRPDAKITTMQDTGINYELLASVMSFLAQDKFDRVTRMGGSFETYELDGRGEARLPRAAQTYAMQVVGLDAGLGEHSLEQLRRGQEAAGLQQYLLSRVFADIHANYGNKRATIKAHHRVKEQYRSIGTRDANLLMLCGLLHDFGEAATGRDIPLEQRSTSNAIYELGRCIDYANTIFTIKGAPKIESMLAERVAKADNPDAAIIRMRNTHAGYYLHPSEITNALAGTEHQVYGEVVRGHMFKGIELREYLLSGIRALEAVECNFANINLQQYIVPKLLRLGVSTFINHIEELSKYAEYYPAFYDFLRQNEARIDHYMKLVMADIDYIDQNPNGSFSNTTFGNDPFIDYPTVASDRISREYAKKRFKETAAYWNKWKKRDHLVRFLWETYLGTEHPLTANQKDVSFLQYTAQTSPNESGLVVVKKPLTDIWGQGIDERSREERRLKILRVIEEG